MGRISPLTKEPTGIAAFQVRYIAMDRDALLQHMAVKLGSVNSSLYIRIEHPAGQSPELITRIDCACPMPSAKAMQRR